ncbi:MAG TPA: formylglycine-generating enzyme family protein [Polyangiaceae bacterium]
MARLSAFAVVLAAGAAHAQASPTLPAGMVGVGSGVLELFDPPSASQTQARVPRFFLDKAPVTNAQYLEFVKAHPEWQRGAAPRLLADEHYLTKWEGPLVLGANADPNGPIVRVSWFAARAYCQSKGARLPSENEWELAARASETNPAPVTDPQRDQLILAWYGQPTPTRMPPVMQRKPNFWGVYDLHGLIWEWVNDFNSRVVSDGRRTDEALVCGGGSLRAADKTNYAAFMRMAFRASLRGSYATADLGFRCARDEKAAGP